MHKGFSVMCYLNRINNKRVCLIGVLWHIFISPQVLNFWKNNDILEKLVNARKNNECECAYIWGKWPILIKGPWPIIQNHSKIIKMVNSDCKKKEKNETWKPN